MPRSNRPRRRRGATGAAGGHGARNKFATEHQELDAERILAGGPRVEHKGDGDWFVRPISAANAAKTYTCPGCAGAIAPGTPHVVVWRDDWVLGDASALADRRHWHTGCWRARSFRRR